MWPPFSASLPPLDDAISLTDAQQLYPLELQETTQKASAASAARDAFGVRRPECASLRDINGRPCFVLWSGVPDSGDPELLLGEFVPLAPRASEVAELLEEVFLGPH